MKINRHNYEEYFILYADKELSSDEHRMVEEFVSLNPDLKDELDVYLNTVLLPDVSVEFENKEELQHHDDALISYLDNELTEDEKMQLEELMKTSPRLQNELEIYRKTKLQPEADIVFENKSVLYRSTEKRGVVSMRFIRWAAAAAVLLAVSITAINVFDNNSNESSTAEANPPKTDSTEINTAAIKPETENKNPFIPDNSPQPTIEKTIQPNDIVKSIVKEKSVLANKKSDIINTKEKQNENIAIKIQQPPSNNLPTRQNNPYINSGNQKNDALVVKTNQKPTDAVTNSDKDPYNTESQASNKKQSETEFASLTTIDEEGNKNKKSRGLFRKLTRVFEKNTGIKATDDDDKLHIAAFTVKLK